MKNIGYYSLFALYTVLFSSLMFLGRSIFFPPTWEEEQYIEPSISQDIFIHDDGEEYYSFSWVTQEELDAAHEILYDFFTEQREKEEKEKLTFRYIPTGYKESIKNNYVPLAEVFLYERNILREIDELGVFFYQNRWDTRGRMKSGNIHLFWVSKMTDEEFLGVLIHEFAHYFDIYSMQRSSFWDQSEKFYDISWDSVSIIRSGQRSEDFVSGYSMTNQYEDFAESYLFYILHNRAFRTKAETSDALALKYDFFRKYVFQANQFYNEDFWLYEEVSSYYWDITKVPVDVNNFLQYLQDEI